MSQEDLAMAAYEQYRVLSEYEIGHCSQAINMMTRVGKPICEIMTRHADPEDLEHDLVLCIRQANQVGKVFHYFRAIHSHPGKFNYGFYTHRWAMEALDFIDKNEIPSYHRSWILGRVFGYTPDAIQEFIDKNNLLP